VASLVPTAWATSRADIAPTRARRSSGNRPLIARFGLVRMAVLATKLDNVVFSSEALVICSKCYTVRQG